MFAALLDTSHSQSRVRGTGQTDGRGSGEERTPAATSGQMRVSAEDLGMFPGSQVPWLMVEYHFHFMFYVDKS